MKLGLMLGYSGAKMSLPVELVQRAEALGFDSVWTAEAYGSDATSPLAFLAAVTKRIRLGTSIMQLAGRTPIYGNYPVAGAAVNGATKAAVNVLSESLRQESQGRIKVTTIRPTGVPGTGLGAGVINPKSLTGILGANEASVMQNLVAVMSENPPPELTDPDDMGYCALSPELLADQIVYAIDQPWGVSISDLTVRASADGFVI